jgi:hypothetical protein
MGMESTVQGPITTMKVEPGETIIIKAGSNKIELSDAGITITGLVKIVGAPSIALTGPVITADKIIVG